MFPFLTIAAYKFAPLTDLKERRAQLLALCKELQVKGSILLSLEGINLFVAGEPECIERLLSALRAWPGLEDLEPKISGTEGAPFRRMHVRVKKEIIAFGVEGIDPTRHTSPKLPAQELKRWLDEGRPVTLLDTRNNYEVRVGSFRDAMPIGIDHFREFPDAVRKLDPALKQQPVVIFCTGGIRCEKAGPFMEREGFEQVFQLDGGILKYFETCGAAHFRGECFVFDQRTAVAPRDVPPLDGRQAGAPTARGLNGLEADAKHSPKEWTQCFRCRTPLSAEEQRHVHFVVDRSCPYCYRTPAEQMQITIAQRREHISRMIVPLPGSIPRDHLRPISIPADCDGLRLIDALQRIIAHVAQDYWTERFAQSLILDGEGRPVGPERIVRGGERYQHCFPGLLEPDVNMRFDVIHEDESIIVINKPAPLPMHAGGRFYRNTLKYVLDEVYRPQKLRPAHRLDANTTGALVIARTQFIAGKIQPQFARGEVDKRYLVRVHGHPQDSAFSCDAPISAAAGEIGSRIIDVEAGLDARTEFQVLARSVDGTALLEARPLTGRTNQIRVHLWHLGFPVCGDRSYLPGKVLGDTQTLAVDAPPLCLHAWRITFKHPVLKERVTFMAPPPTWVREDLTHV